MKKENEELNIFGVNELDGLINSYYQNKQSLDNYKKITDEQNAKIKELMTKGNLTEFTTMRDVVAKLTVQKKESFNEELLIETLKNLGIKKPIKKVEVVDYDILENLIYNNEIDATALSNCRVVKETPTLRVKGK